MHPVISVAQGDNHSSNLPQTLPYSSQMVTAICFFLRGRGQLFGLHRIWGARRSMTGLILLGYLVLLQEVKHT